MDGWAALAAGISTPDQWMDWFNRPFALAQEFSADISWMPAALRRRVSPAGRAALGVLAACQTAPCPVVFASAYGDLADTAELLAQLHAEGIVSPMGFSLAVHNAPVGVYSIARQDRTTTTSIAARTDLAESAFLEAIGWLANGVEQVVVVCSGDCIPEPYAATTRERGVRHAWACRLRLASSGGFSLDVADEAGVAVADGAVTGSSPAADPPDLKALAFLVGGKSEALTSETGRYLWWHHA